MSHSWLKDLDIFQNYIKSTFMFNNYMAEWLNINFCD